MAFNNATRQNFRNFTVLPFIAGQRQSKDLPRTGLLANIFVRVQGKLKVTKGTGTATLKANQHNQPYGLINRLLLTANSGTEIVNVTGQGLAFHNMIAMDSKMDIPSANMPFAVAGNPVYQFGTIEGDNDVQFTLKIPVVINDRDDLGLILLQNGETLITLSLDFADPKNLFNLSGDAKVEFAGNAYCSYEYYSVPQDPADYPDLSLAHTLIESMNDIDGVGELSYTVPRGNIYQRMIHRVLINDAPAGFDDVESLKLIYNQSETPYHVFGQDQLMLQRYRYGRDLPKGVYVWDWSYQGLAGLGGARDFINSKSITDFLSQLQISNSAVLGTNNNKLITLREQLVPLI